MIFELYEELCQNYFVLVLDRKDDTQLGIQGEYTVNSSELSPYLSQGTRLSQ